MNNLVRYFVFGRWVGVNRENIFRKVLFLFVLDVSVVLVMSYSRELFFMFGSIFYVLGWMIRFGVGGLVYGMVYVFSF